MAKVEWAKKIGFGGVSPRWYEFSDQLVVDATIAMGSSKGYFPAWDGLLKKRFDKPIPSTVPITIIFGDSDNTLPARTCQERSLVPQHAKWIILPESGHAPMWDHASECIDEILRTAGKQK
jgi:pimeloyl-ACP methyl ester carboxylesterase